MLSTAAATYKGKDRDAAARLLNRKIRFVTDNHLKILPGLASYTIPDHSIDFLLLVPNEPGLSVLLPPADTAAPASSRFILDLSKPTRQLSTKHGLFGFDPQGAALYIGRKEQQNIWLVMVDDEVISASTPAFPAGTLFKGGTAMSRRHLRIIQTFILFALCRAGVPGFWDLGPSLYDVDLEDERADWPYAPMFK